MHFDKTHWSWINGNVPWTDSKVHIFLHALHYGTGIFEGMRSYMTPDGPAVFRMDAHLERFFRWAAVSVSTYVIPASRLRSRLRSHPA